MDPGIARAGQEELRRFGEVKEPPTTLIRAYAVWSARFSPHAAPPEGATQRDLFVSSCDQKTSGSFGDPVIQEAGNGSHEDTKTRRRQARGCSRRGSCPSATTACWQAASRDSQGYRSREFLLLTRRFGVSRCMRLSRPQRRRGAEDQISCLSVSASPRAILLQADSASGRCHGRQPRSISRCMRLIRPQRRRDAEFLLTSPRLRVSAGDCLPKPIPTAVDPMGSHRGTSPGA